MTYCNSGFITKPSIHQATNGNLDDLGHLWDHPCRPQFFVIRSHSISIHIDIPIIANKSWLYNSSVLAIFCCTPLQTRSGVNKILLWKKRVAHCRHRGEILPLVILWKSYKILQFYRNPDRRSHPLIHHASRSIVQAEDRPITPRLTLPRRLFEPVLRTRGF